MARFLCAVFGVPDSHRMFQEDVLRWKCFTPHPFWEGDRGYALRYKGAMAAFGCLVPCRFLTGSQAVASCNVIDWAASKAVPGAGIILYRHIRTLTGTMINIGGTPDALHVLPQIGFAPRTEIHQYTRVIRPLRHLAGRKGWKSPLRLARDYGELARPAEPAPSWSAAKVAELPRDTFPDPSVTGQVVGERTAASLAYFLSCPVARMELYRVERGYFLLSHVDRQCRIADLWVNSAEPRDWAKAYAAAAAAARADSQATEVTAGASSPLQTKALEQAGYRRVHSEPVFVLDPDFRLAGRRDLALGFLENDAFYWSPTPANSR